jgi:hypothetical protein
MPHVPKYQTLSLKITPISLIIPPRVLASWKGKKVLFFNYSSERVPERVRDSLQSAFPDEGIEIRSPHPGSNLPPTDALIGQYRVNGVLAPKSQRNTTPRSPLLKVISWQCRPHGVLLEEQQRDGSWSELD